MNVEDFVRSIRKQVLQSNMDIYRELFRETKRNDATDEYWQCALSLYGSLDDDMKEVLFAVIRQVMVDTISSIFALLDGVSLLENQEEDFELLHSGQRLNGDLHDIFLKIEESES